MKKKKKSGPSIMAALGGGLIGACTVTLLHESIRRFKPDAPRMDILGMRAIAKGLNFAGLEKPEDNKLHDMALAGDIVSNSLYYSLAGSGKNAVAKGIVLGLAAGIGGVVLPGPMGLGSAPGNRTTETQLLTVAYYFLGGVAAAATAREIAKACKR